ncbi:MAG: uroporphyrinogen decarboxylase family protein [Spirochaetia bacterium]
MTSRERVLRAFEHREPDYIPVDFSGHRSSGIAAIAYARLREALGLPQKKVQVYDPIQQLAIVDEEVRASFFVDTQEMGRGFAREDKDWNDWTLPDGAACQLPAWVPVERRPNEWVLLSKTGTELGRMPDGALYFEQTNYPFLESEDLSSLRSAFEQSMWLSSAGSAPPGPVSHEELKKGAQKLRRSTDKAIVGLFGGSIFETGQFLYRNDNFYMLLAAEPARAEAFLDALVEVHLENLRLFLGAVGDSIDVIAFGDDLGTQQGPQISPDMYRKFFKPRHRLLWETAKKLAPAGRGGKPGRPALRVMLHSCGGIRELLPDMIDAGLEAVNPVQITCRGMETSALKRDLGKDIVFWGGGCDTQGVLLKGTPAEVRDHVRRQVDVMAQGGGFVFQQVHNILANVPPANITAMFETVNQGRS